MNLNKKINLCFASILCVLSLTACGNSSNTPKCVDKDVQEEVANFMKEKNKTRNHKKPCSQN